MASAKSKAEPSQEKLDAAIRVISTNCKLIPDERAAFEAYATTHSKKVRSLARTSPEYQRHIVGRFFDGDKNPFRRIAATLLIYDTVRFGEVTSRLHRALGSVRKEGRYLKRCLDADIEPGNVANRLLLLDLIAEKGRSLSELLEKTRATGKSSRLPTAVPSAPNSDVPTKDRIYAGSALGLIAKNVFNVPRLQGAHRPTVAKKLLAIDLTKRATEAAEQTADLLRARFGSVDESYRVRGRSKPERRIITRKKPDGDAIVSAWLAERFLFGGRSVEVLFVDRGRVLGAYSEGDCLVDVGNTHDPKNLFFDHKPPAFADRNDHCAAELIWEYLRKSGHQVEHLKRLVRGVFAGDSSGARKIFASEYRDSTAKDGFHTALARIKESEKSASGIYRAARTWLDRRFRL